MSATRVAWWLIRFLPSSTCTLASSSPLSSGATFFGPAEQAVGQRFGAAAEPVDPADQRFRAAAEAGEATAELLRFLRQFRGAGSELLATALHFFQPFVELACAAVGSFSLSLKVISQEVTPWLRHDRRAGVRAGVQFGRQPRVGLDLRRRRNRVKGAPVTGSLPLTRRARAAHRFQRRRVFGIGLADRHRLQAAPAPASAGFAR